MHIYACLYMYIYTYMRMYIYIYICKFVCIHICVYIYFRPFMHFCMYLCMYVRIVFHIFCVCTFEHFKHTHKDTHTQFCLMLILSCLLIVMTFLTHKPKHTHTHSLTHTHIHTDTHICLHMLNQKVWHEFRIWTEHIAIHCNLLQSTST